MSKNTNNPELRDKMVENIDRALGMKDETI